MEALGHLLRLGTAGLLLDTGTFRAQRDNPAALRDGFLLVSVIGLLVGVASFIGSALTRLASPDPLEVLEIIRRGLNNTVFITEIQRANPAFNLDPFFDALAATFNATQQTALFSPLLTPLIYLFGWLVYGTVAHLAARLLGGDGTFAKTLGCTALASGANLLAIIQIVPFAQVAGTTLLGLIGCYLGLRAAHNLPAWNAFWAALLGPILLIVALIVVSCGLLGVLIASV